MLNTHLFEKVKHLYDQFVGLENRLQSPFLLAIRLFWGWHFFLTGKGKLMNLDQTTSFFTDLGLPMPHLNAIMAGTTECVGGLLLLLGLGSRIAGIPLTMTMIVAYLTAHHEALVNIFNKPDDFLTADPFLFLMTTVIVVAFGPGLFSLDAIIKRLVTQPAFAKLPARANQGFPGTASPSV